MESIDENSKRRLDNFNKPNLNCEDLRRRRNEQTVEIRKNKRDNILRNKRMASASEIDDSEPTDFSNMPELTNELLSQLIEDICLYDKNAEYCFLAVKTVRKYLSQDTHPPIDMLIDGGILSPLVQCLNLNQHPNIQFEAAWAITNVASGNSDQTKKVVDSGAADVLVRLLYSDSVKVIEQSFWALGNIIGDGPMLRNYVFGLGIIDPLLKYVESKPDLSFLRNITWVIVNLCRYKNPPLEFQYFNQLIPALFKLITYEDKSVLVDTLWALSYLTDCGVDYVQAVIDSGIIRSVVPYLSHNEAAVQTAALRALGNVVTGTDEQTQVVLDCNVLGYFQFLLKHEKVKMRKEAVWFLSNITAGSQHQIQQLVDANLLPLILDNLRSSDFPVQKESIWAISNLTLNGSSEHIKLLLENDFIKPFCDFLQFKDPQMLQVVLEGILNMLRSTSGQMLATLLLLIEECGGLDRIELLQSHENAEIYKVAYEIIEKYFTDNIDDQQLLPDTTDDQFIFQSFDEVNSTFDL